LTERRMKRLALRIFCACLAAFACQGAPLGEATSEPAAGVDAKPKVAFFPLAGSAGEEVRAKVGFSLRTKLDREGHYEVIDGPRMADLAADTKAPIALDSKVDEIKELGKQVDASVLVWGEMNGDVVKLKVLDLRLEDGKVQEIEKAVHEPQELRFVVEQILETLPNVEQFEHPNEEAVQNDAAAEALWKKGRNLIVNGDFSEPGQWDALYQSEKYAVQISDSVPEVDKVNIYRLPGEKNNVLAMNLSKTCAENNGMACLSKSFNIEANTRYRISFRYKSDGPVLHVFVKGYTLAEDIKGQKTEREIYRRQVPPSGATGGKWVTVVDDLNPQHIAFPVQSLKVDLYAYLTPGMVMFDDVVVKEVGKQTRHAHDAAIVKPVTRPMGAKD